MNKGQLQKELLEKVKEGVKPSDLKKNKNTTPNIPTPPTPPLPREKNMPLSSQPKSEPKKEESKKQPIFYCYACRTNKRGVAQMIKVAQTDLEYNLVRSQQYSFCSPCSPKIKELTNMTWLRMTCEINTLTRMLKKY